MSRFVTFGEIMLRLTPPEHEVLFQTDRLVATFGGAEANVAVSLANYGENVSYVTAAPANPVGDAMIKEVRSFGICTDHILRKGERLGIYFTETGAAKTSVPASSQARMHLQLSSQMYSSSAEIKPLRSNTGINLAGEIMPFSGCIHRTSASAPTISPLA